MSNITPTPPSHTLFYWKPWRENADFNSSWLDYKKDVTLAKYTADSIGQYIAQANNNQVNAINDVGKKIGLGLNVMSSKLDTIGFQLGSIESEIGIVNQNLELQIEQQRISNILLENIGELLRVPNSEKERQRHIEIGLKFYVNASKDEDLFDDAIKELQKAESLMSQDYFVLHRIGMIYLHSIKHIDINKAFDYFSKAGKYASVESDPKATRLVNVLTKNSSVVNSKINKDVNSITILASESYEKAAFCLYINGKVEEAIEFQSKAIKFNDTPKNHFWLAKYQARGNKIDDCISNLNIAIESEPKLTLLLFKDLDLINLPESIKLIEEKNDLFSSIIKRQLNLWLRIDNEISKKKIEELSNYLSKEFHERAFLTKNIQNQEKRCSSKISELKNKINNIINSHAFSNAYTPGEQNDIMTFLENLNLIEELPVELFVEKTEELYNIASRYIVNIGDEFLDGIVFKKSGTKLYITKKDFVIKYDDNSGWQKLSYNKSIKTLKELGENWRFPTIEELKEIYKIKNKLDKKLVKAISDDWSERRSDDDNIYGSFVWSSTEYEEKQISNGYVVTRPASLFFSEKKEWVEYLRYINKGVKTLSFANGEESTYRLIMQRLEYQTGNIEDENSYCDEDDPYYFIGCYLLPVREV